MTRIQLIKPDKEEKMTPSMIYLFRSPFLLVDSFFCSSRWRSYRGQRCYGLDLPTFHLLSTSPSTDNRSTRNDFYGRAFGRQTTTIMDESPRGRNNSIAAVEPASSRPATTRAMSIANAAQQASPLPSIVEGQEQRRMTVLTPSPRPRKRRASVMTNAETEGHHPVMRPPSASTSTHQEDYSRAPGPAGNDSSPQNICLCPPDLHIPRPRNGEPSLSILMACPAMALLL